MVLWPLIATSYAGDIFQIEKRPLNLIILIMLQVGVILPQTRCTLKAYNYLSLLIYKNQVVFGEFGACSCWFFGTCRIQTFLKK